MTPEQAQWLVQAGAWVILVLLVGTIFVTGAREVWVWGTTLKRALAEKTLVETALRADNAALRASLDANTLAGKAAADQFVQALDDLGDRFERELERLTDELRELRRSPGAIVPSPLQPPARRPRGQRV